MRVIKRWGRAFGLFWWDFLVGDTPELFVATLVIVGLALLLGRHHESGYLLLPALAILFLVLSAYRGRRRTGPVETIPTEQTDPRS
jgi:hypothetical protein